jgi:preprotein translocase subunit SecE
LPFSTGSGFFYPAGGSFNFDSFISAEENVVVKSSTSNKAERKTPERLDPSSRGSSKSETTEAKGPFAFFRNTREEFDKIVWPTRQQLISESVAVLLIVVVFASFIYLIDQGFGWVSHQIFR